MSVSYAALGDKLSNTDPISNSVLISGLDFSRDGANLLLAGRYPMACLNSYIHESLHHMCFRTPVGTAIAYLYHRAFLRACDHVTLQEASPFDDYHVLEDVARVETILHIMRPLAEGIALFGEFDAWPGESLSLSATFRSVAVAFAEAVPNWREKRLPEILHGILARGRSRPAAQRRKENLLMQGFTTCGGGYLPGYFLVKNLQIALCQCVRSPLLLDSEYYLNFLIHWFYGDFGLVHALLDETKEMASFTQHSVIERDSINAISVAFQRRFSELFKLTADQIEWHDKTIGAQAVPWWQSQIGMDLIQARQMDETLENRVNELIDYTDAASSPGQQALRALCHDNFVRRDYMCVGSFDEEIEILANGRVQLARNAAHANFPVMSFGQSDMPGPYTGRAVVDILQSGASEKRFFAVYAGPDRVTLNSLADDFEDERERLAGINLSTSQCRVAKEWMRTAIDNALPPDGSAAVLRTHYREQAERGADAIYRNWCGAMMQAHGREAHIPADPGVLLTMCDRDSRFLRTVAALGCSGSLLLGEDEIVEACASNSISVDAFRGRARAVEERHGFRFFNPLGDHVILAI